MYEELNGYKIRYCKVCGLEIPDFNEYFCSEECEEFYHEHELNKETELIEQEILL